MCASGIEVFFCAYELVNLFFRKEYLLSLLQNSALLLLLCHFSMHFIRSRVILSPLSIQSNIRELSLWASPALYHWIRAIKIRAHCKNPHHFFYQEPSQEETWELAYSDAPSKVEKTQTHLVLALGCTESSGQREFVASCGCNFVCLHLPAHINWLTSFLSVDCNCLSNPRLSNLIPQALTINLKLKKFAYFVGKAHLNQQVQHFYVSFSL